LRGLIAVPAYNEAATLPSVIASLRAELPGIDLLVIDDGSRDETPNLLRGLDVRSARHPCNLGYGRAIQTALRVAEEGDYDYVITVDGDGQHPAPQAKALLQHFLVGEMDMCIGSRFVSNRAYSGIPLSRKLGMLTFSWLARVVTGQRFYDTTSGLKVMRKTIFAPLTRSNLVDFHAEAIVYLTRLGFIVSECGVTMGARRHGTSMYSFVDLFAYPLKTFLMVVIASVQASLARASEGR
jgi:glycosyltransferase involved in cell wall biosynthesis